MLRNLQKICPKQSYTKRGMPILQKMIAPVLSSTGGDDGDDKEWEKVLFYATFLSYYYQTGTEDD